MHQEDPPMTTELETAMAAARRAGDGGPIDGFVVRMADRIGAKVNVKTVFGEPVERDGITVIPVAKVRWGFGGGAGRGPVAVGPGLGSETAENASTDAEWPSTDRPTGAATDGAGAAEPGYGTGGGGGATADPVGYIEIGPDGAVFRPIVPAMPSPGFMLAVGATTALVLRGLARLLRR
jgi:uncharacterized spore protein YtfJ